MRLGALTLVVLASCAQVSMAPGQAGPAAIEGEALRNTISGQHLFQGSLANHVSEHFCRDGRWSVTGTRAPMYGTWSIDGARFCNSRDGGHTQCRSLYRAPDGGYETELRPTPDPAAPRMAVALKPDDGSC